MTTDIPQLYKNIRSKRMTLGMTQQELADKTGYTSRSTINKIEKGLVDLPQSKIDLFAKALRTSPAKLMQYHIVGTGEKGVYVDSFSEAAKLYPKLVKPVSRSRRTREEKLQEIIKVASEVITGDVTADLTDEEYAMIDKFSLLTDNNKQLLSNMIDTLLMQQGGDSDTQKDAPSLQQRLDVQNK